MAAAVIFMKWESYKGGKDNAGFFTDEPLTFNSGQERLHCLAPGDRLWLVSRCPEDGQYYFVAGLTVLSQKRNTPESEKGRLYGQYALVCNRVMSLDLGKQFPAEALLRAFVFETNRPIRYGASIGQSLQTLRLFNEDDERVLNAVFGRIGSQCGPWSGSACGLWTKCDGVFADYFLKNWKVRREPLGFLLYDPPPAVRTGRPIFIHSDKSLRLVARFVESQYVAGYKLTVENDERLAERERVWSRYRVNTINPPTKPEFDEFWEGQHGVRALFLMDEVVALPEPVLFKVYGRALEWGYPMGVGYRYLSLEQSVLLLRMAELPGQSTDLFLQNILGTSERVD